MSRYTYRSSRTNGFEVFVGLLTLVFLVGFLIVSCVIKPYYQLSGKETLIITVLNTDVKQKDGDTQTYMISARNETTGEDEVFESSDTTLYGKYNSADVYFLLKNNIGKRFRVTVVGHRVPFWSLNRNILTAELVP